MPHSSQTPEPWHSFLFELDREATGETRLDCMGGFVVTLLYGLPRATADLDVLLIAPGEQRAPCRNLAFGAVRFTGNTRSIWITSVLPRCRRTTKIG